MQSLLLPVVYATTVSSALPVAAGLARYSRNKLDTKLLLWLFILVLAIDCYCLYCAGNKISANWLHHIYTPIEYAIFAFAISSWQAGRVEKKVILFSIPAFVLLGIWDMIEAGDFQKPNDFMISVACALYIGMAAYTLIGIERLMAGRLSKDYRFWFLLGLLVNSSGNLAYFSFFKNVFSYYLWAGHNVLNILANICYMMGFICRARRD